MIVAHEWGVRPLDIMNWTEAELATALAFLKWKNDSAKPDSEDSA
jgi:hypothetical protein